MLPSRGIFYSNFEVLRARQLSLGLRQNRLTFNLEPSPPRTLVKYNCFISFSSRDGNPGYIEEPPDKTMCL